MKYLHKSETTSDWTNRAYIEPNVQYITSTNKIEYNKTLEQQYEHNCYAPLTFEIISSGAIGINRISNSGTSWTFSYRKNYEQWQTATATSSRTLYIQVKAGDCVEFKSEDTPGARRFKFTSTCTFNLSGNIMSLGCSNDINRIYVNCAFWYLFKDCTHLVSAEHLILSAKIPCTQCYQSMFEGCTSLIKAPVLSLTTLAYQGVGYSSCCNAMFKGCTSLTTAPELFAGDMETSGYEEMFMNCTSLNYIKISFSPAMNAHFTNWVSGVSPTGTFVRKSSSWNLTGVNAIPEGWTVETATA